MSVFGALGIAGSGLVTHRKWLDAVSDNVANINDATSTDKTAFQERMVQAQAVDYGSGTGGVRVAGVRFGSAEGRLVHEPGNPLADKDGNVRYPDIDLGEQMTQMMMAQRGYQANLQTMSAATQAYQAALQLGKHS
jgi:flagellar basal-body rod protein FlgC